MSTLPVIFDGAQLGVIDPETGECFSVANAPGPVLAAVRERVAAVADDARRAKDVLDDALRERLGPERRADYGAYRVEVNVSNRWDPDDTWAALADLCEQGLVTPAQVDEAMPETTVRKPDGRRLNALLTDLVGRDPSAAAPLARARATRRWVRVEKTAVDSDAVVA